MDYQKELEKYQEVLTGDEKKELELLAGFQKDIAISDSAEDFIRHPFFRVFQDQMNAMITDANGEIASLLKKPGVTIEDLKTHQAGVEAIKKLKMWLNKRVLAGRIAKQGLTVYEQDTEEMNSRIQAAVDQSHQ